MQETQTFRLFKGVPTALLSVVMELLRRIQLDPGSNIGLLITVAWSSLSSTQGCIFPADVPSITVPISPFLNNCWNLPHERRSDPSSLTRGRYKIPNRNCLKEKLKEKEKLVAGPRWAPDTKTDWPTDCRS
jgi:hypothetical protein